MYHIYMVLIIVPLAHFLEQFKPEIRLVIAASQLNTDYSGINV